MYFDRRFGVERAFCLPFVLWREVVVLVVVGHHSRKKASHLRRETGLQRQADCGKLCS